MSSNLLIPRVCEFCHQTFIAKKTVTRFCKSQCSKSSRRAKAVALRTEVYNSNFAGESVKSKKPLLDKKWYAVQDIAEIFGLSNKWVYQLINTGYLQSIKITARKTRISRDELERFMALRAVEPAVVVSNPVIGAKGEIILIRETCYNVAEVMEIFGKTRGDAYMFLKRSGVSKIKIKKEVFFSKQEVDQLFRKFVKPRQLAHDKERAVNQKLAAKGVKVEDCYSMQQCEELFGRKRENLYSKFSRRNVAKIRQGHSVYYLKKSVDSIYRSIEGGKGL